MSWHLGSPQGTSAFSFTPDQRLMISAGGAPFSGNVTLWDVTRPAGLRRLSVFEGAGSAAISPDGRTVATVAFGGQPALWDVARPRHPRRLAVLFAGASGDLWGQAYSPDGAVLANASTTALTLWDVARPARLRLLRVLRAPVPPENPGPVQDLDDADLAFSPRGTILASVTGRDQITLWNVARPARAARIATITSPRGSRDYFVSLAFSPDGRLLAGLTYGGTLIIYRVADPSRPAAVAIRRQLLDGLRYPEGALAADWPSSTSGAPEGYGVPAPAPCADTCFPPAYAAGFAPGARSLTVVIGLDQQSNRSPGVSWSRDTVFTWAVSAAGALPGPAVLTRPAIDGQPGLSPDARIIADGIPFGSSRPPSLWTLPAPAAPQLPAITRPSRQPAKTAAPGAGRPGTRSPA
jgi:hypothetical protein